MIEERLTAEQFIPQPQPIYLAMDNAPIHNAHIVREWFHQHPDVIRLPWPARAPDLNPIEHLWSQITNKWDYNEVRDKETLVNHSCNIWESLRASDICYNLVNSMSRRLQAVIVSEGSYTRY